MVALQLGPVVIVASNNARMETYVSVGAGALVRVFAVAHLGSNCFQVAKEVWCCKRVKVWTLESGKMG